jgi:hypothetical protein
MLTLGRPRTDTVRLDVLCLHVAVLVGDRIAGDVQRRVADESARVLERDTVPVLTGLVNTTVLESSLAVGHLHRRVAGRTPRNGDVFEVERFALGTSPDSPEIVFKLIHSI